MTEINSSVFKNKIIHEDIVRFFERDEQIRNFFRNDISKRIRFFPLYWPDNFFEDLSPFSGGGDFSFIESCPDYALNSGRSISQWREKTKFITETLRESYQKNEKEFSGSKLSIHEKKENKENKLKKQSTNSKIVSAEKLREKTDGTVLENKNREVKTFSKKEPVFPERKKTETNYKERDDSSEKESVKNKSAGNSIKPEKTAKVRAETGSAEKKIGYSDFIDEKEISVKSFSEDKKHNKSAAPSLKQKVKSEKRDEFTDEPKQKNHNSFTLEEEKISIEKKNQIISRIKRIAERTRVIISGRILINNSERRSYFRLF